MTVSKLETELAGGIFVRSKFFWLAVLGFAILVGIISCVASDSEGRSSASLPAPILPDENEDYSDYDQSADVIGYDEEPAPEDPGELDIQSNSVFIAERYAGFLTWGYFSHSAVAAPVPFAEASVLDTLTGREISLEEILDIDNIDSTLALLAEALLAYTPEAASYLYMIDENWLSHFILDRNGIRVLLPPSIASWDLGFISILLTYEDLGEAILLKEELGLQEPVRRPMVALTFDDGPSIYTNMILDMLEEHGGRVTFCVLGDRIQYHPDTLRRAVALGSEVIGHSWDHSDLARLNANAITDQITRTTEAIADVIGHPPPTVFRAPYGNTNSRVINTSRELGYSLLHWSVDPQDWHHRDADWIYNSILSRVIDGSIVVLHDVHTTTMEAMERVIPRLIAEGFQLVTASEVIAYFYGELEPGEIYQGLRLPWGVYIER